MTLPLSLNSKQVYAADTTPPVTSYVQTPPSAGGNNGWFITPVQFDLSATDLESGVKEINYRIDDTGAWQKVSFSSTLNLAPNPSFETVNVSSPTGIDSWDATGADSQTTFSRDTLNYAPSFAAASAKITSTATGMWHGINNQVAFTVTSQYQNMSTSVWLKTQSVTESAYFKVYAIVPDGNGGQTSQLLGQSSGLTGLNDWTKLSLSFVVNAVGTTGVFLDIGFTGSGTVWADAVTLDSSTSSATVSVTVGADSANHTFAFYAVDNANNAETYNCVTPVKNCVTFKLDQTSPGNWHNSGATRGFTGSDHELWVYTNVEDTTSGLSIFTDKYQYYTERNPTFGTYTNILNCGSTWQPNDWNPLISPPFQNGVHSAYLITPKTDFCNNNWKICKIVRFYSEDMAGNEATKDFCINGPWIKVRNGGIVRSNQNIDMLSEASGDNTDGLIEVGGTNISFFSSSKNWKITQSGIPEDHLYDYYWNAVSNAKTQITTQLAASSGIYYKTGDFTINQQSIPSSYGTTTFNQIVFINGNLTIDKDISVSSNSAALFIVSGNVNISKSVNALSVGIFTNGQISTAYDLNESEGSGTLVLHGIYAADKFNFQRTLQGTNNSTDPSEDFTYEPKYLINLKSFFTSSSVKWNAED